MHGLARFLEICIPSVKWLSLPEEVHFFSQAMLQQLDLRHEAKNLAAFNENFGLVNRHISSLFQHQPPSAPPLSSSPNSSSYDLERIFKLDHNSPIFFPKPLPGYVKERVLVETFFDSALPMSTFLKKGPTVFSNTLANIGINGFLVNTIYVLVIRENFKGNITKRDPLVLFIENAYSR